MLRNRRSVARTLLSAAATACAGLLATPHASADTTWLNTGTSWNIAANWNNGLPSTISSAWLPAAASGTNPFIAASTVTPLGIHIDNSGGKSYSINASVTFSQSATTYNGTISLGSGSYVATGGGSTALNANVAISGATSFTTDTGNTTVISGNFAGGASNTITKLGAGTLQFKQSATFTSGLTINANAGVLELRNSKALGSAPVITVGNSAVLQIDPTLKFSFNNESETPNGFGDLNTQTILQNGSTLRDGAAGADVTFDLPLFGVLKIQNAAAATITMPTNGAFTIAGTITNTTDAPAGTSSSIHVTGAGILTLDNASPATNAYTGSWNIDHGISGGITGITFLRSPTGLGVSSSGYAAPVTLTSGYLSDVNSTAGAPVPNPITFNGGALNAKASNGSGTDRTNSYFSGAINLQSVGGSTIDLSDTGFSDLSGLVCGMTLSGRISGAGALYLTAPTINPTTPAVVAFTNTSTVTPNNLSGILIVQWNAALAATTSTSGSDPLGSAAVSLAGGELRLSHAGSGSSGSINAFAGNSVTLRGYTNSQLGSVANHDGTITLDNASTANTNNVIQLGALTFDSTGTSAAQTLTIQNASPTPHYSAKFTGVTTIAGTATITTGANAANIELAGKLTGSGSFIKAGNNTVTLSGTSSDYTGSTTVNAGSLVFNNTYQIGGLSIASAAQASVTPGGDKLLKVTSLAITSGGTLDLNDEDAIVTSGTPSTFRGLIATGFAGGAWSGSGLTSSTARTIAASATIHKTALGYATATQAGVSAFDGVHVNGTDILIRYTLSGDATLDGTVNSGDFDALAANFGTTSTGVWAAGDFNYDGIVNTLDFNAIATNFGGVQAAPLPDLALASAFVPEPIATLPLVISSFIFAGQRRKRFLRHR